MEMFEFGDQLPFVDRAGRTRTRDQYSLHVQRPSRLVRGGQLFVGYEDLTTPGIDRGAATAGRNSAASTRRDELMAQFLRGTRLEQRLVVHGQASKLGDLN
jgi:hypothetical protein